jgi:hypothetical protein
VGELKKDLCRDKNTLPVLTWRPDKEIFNPDELPIGIDSDPGKAVPSSSTPHSSPRAVFFH